MRMCNPASPHEMAGRIRRHLLIVRATKGAGYRLSKIIHSHSGEDPACVVEGVRYGLRMGWWVCTAGGQIEVVEAEPVRATAHDAATSADEALPKRPEVVRC